MFNNDGSINTWRTIWVGGIVVAFLLACIVALYVMNVGGFLADTQVNNKYIQPAQRSRLDNDANYRRGIEAEAQGDYAAYQRAVAKTPIDQKTLDDFTKANPQPWTFVQQEQYNNLQAEVQGDQNAVVRAATDYNALVNNPDNAGLLQFDPALPSQLALDGSTH